MILRLRSARRFSQPQIEEMRRVIEIPLEDRELARLDGKVLRIRGLCPVSVP